MKCLKCGADAPPNLNSSLCSSCLNAQWELQRNNGCLTLFLILLAFIVLCAITAHSMTYLHFLLLFCPVGLIATFACASVLTTMRGNAKQGPLYERYKAVNPCNPHIVCPHCQTKGTVRVARVQRKAGISGGKATAAALTGGISLLATGLSRKERVTQAHCNHCGSTWTF